MGCIPSKDADKDAGYAGFAGPIKTVVILVMENRSFDHMLGWQKQRHPEIDGVPGPNTLSNKYYTKDESGQIVEEKTVYFSADAQYVAADDPGHSFQAVRQQIFGGPDPSDDGSAAESAGKTPTMAGFASQAETVRQGFSSTVLSGFTPEALPIYTDLLDNYAVCDRWFASVPASTQPNRQFVHAATSHGLMSNPVPTLLQGLPQRTIFDSIYDAGLDFGIYFQSIPSTLIYRRLRQLKYLEKFHPYDLDFKRHAKEGKLPNYVVIEPRYFNHEIPPANDDHPVHDVSRGQELVKEVYETLRSSPQWNQMLLVITYDEHGGFYDHVPTPVGVPSPDGIVGPEPYFFKFDRLGVRVPAIFVSPWIEKGVVLHEPTGPTASSQFEHSSIPATVKKLFNLPSDYLTKRDAWAGTFESLLTRKTPRTNCPMKLPSVTKDPSASKSEPVKTNMLSEFQEDLVHVASEINGEKDKAKEIIESGIEQAAQYVDDAFTFFLKTCDEAKQTGCDASSVVCISRSHDGSHTYTLEPCE